MPFYMKTGGFRKLNSFCFKGFGSVGMTVFCGFLDQIYNRPQKPVNMGSSSSFVTATAAFRKIDRNYKLFFDEEVLKANFKYLRNYRVKKFKKVSGLS